MPGHGTDLEENTRRGLATKGEADAPSRGAAGRELVSVVTPTRGKTQKWLPQLYRCFLGQTYGPKELIVVDSSKRVSDGDARVALV